jgi:hypothetical protein
MATSVTDMPIVANWPIKIGQAKCQSARNSNNTRGRRAKASAAGIV